MTRTVDSLRLHSTGPPQAGTAIGPVLSTRPKVYDLFKADSAGNIDILSADSTCIHRFSHPLTMGRASASVGSVLEFHLSALAPSSSRDVRFWPLLPLTSIVLETLAQAVGVQVFSGCLSRFVNLQRLFEPMEALNNMLSDLFMGESLVPPTKPATITQQFTFSNLLDEVDCLRLDPALRGLHSLNLSAQHSPSSSMNRPPRPSSPKKKSSTSFLSSIQTSNRPIKTQAMMALGLVSSELSCSVSHSNDLAQLIALMLRFTQYLGWVDWTERLCRMGAGQQEFSSRSQCSPLDQPLMPDLIDHLERIRAGVPSPFDAVFSLPTQEVEPGFYGVHDACLRSKQITSLYHLLFRNAKAAHDLPKALLLQMDRFGWTRDDLDDIPWTMALPLREVLRDGQIGAPMALSESAYDLINRPDLGIVARELGDGCFKGVDRKHRKTKHRFYVSSPV